MRRAVALLLFLLSGCGGSADEPRLATEPTLHVAEAALSGGNPALALQVSEAILAHHPTYSDALAVRGDAQFALGQQEQAAANYGRALHLSPNSVRALLGLGRVRLGSDPAAAEALFGRALANDPRNVAALNDLGIARDLQHRSADAQDAYRHALVLAPNNSATLVNLGLSLALSGHRAEALQVLRPVQADQQAPERVRANLARALTEAGAPDAVAPGQGPATGLTE